jgi:hypothetical protein
VAKRDPAKQLKSYLTGLKKKKLRDGRMAYQQYLDLGIGASCWYKPLTTNWLVFEWQVWVSLQSYGRHPNANTFADANNQRPLATPFGVDDTTVLYVGADEGEREWEYALVWRVGDDFGFRILSRSEVEQVSNFNHAIFRHLIGMRFDRLPPHGVPIRPALL